MAGKELVMLLNDLVLFSFSAGGLSGAGSACRLAMGARTEGAAIWSSSRLTLSREASEVWEILWGFFFSGVRFVVTAAGETSSSGSGLAGPSPVFGRLTEDLRLVRERTEAVSTASSNVSCTTGVNSPELRQERSGATYILLVRSIGRGLLVFLCPMGNWIVVCRHGGASVCKRGEELGCDNHAPSCVAMWNWVDLPDGEAVD